MTAGRNAVIILGVAIGTMALVHATPAEWQGVSTGLGIYLIILVFAQLTRPTR